MGIRFYRPSQGHRLAHDPFNAIIAPRPIGRIGTLTADVRRNLARSSFFDALNDTPPIVGFSSTEHKHPVENIGTADDVDEFERAGLASVPSVDIGEVVAVHIDERLLVDGVSDTAGARPVLRGGRATAHDGIARDGRSTCTVPGGPARLLIADPPGPVEGWMPDVARVRGVIDTPPFVALLIDADNAPLGSLDHVVAVLAEHGEVRIRRAYGNWFKAALKPWDLELSRQGIRPVQQSDPVKGKNATDLALVIDAVDLHHTARPDVFAIVSSDSDYAPLAHYLRERGAKVLGFGRPNTAESFRVACTLFVPLPDATADKPKPEPRREPVLAELLAAAIGKNADKQGWARVSAVANHMRQHHGQAAKDHGKATWTKVLKGLPGYEFRNEGTTNVAVRLR